MRTANLSRPARAFTVLAAVLALGLALAAVPAAAAKSRYKDPVFKRVTITRNLAYGKAPGVTGRAETLRLDLYQPRGDTLSRRPAMIWIHGGGFSSGDKASGPAPELAKLFARLGYVTVSINYRLLLRTGCSGANGVPPECYDAALKDVSDAQAAVRWLRRNAKRYRIDGSRIGVGGESAGAIMSVGVAALSKTPGSSGNPGYSSKVRAFVSISGGVPNGLFIDRYTAPGLLFHGTKDNLVPYQWALDTAAAMRRYHVPVVLKTLRGAGHVPWKQYRGFFERTSTGFVYRYLDVAHAARR